MRYINQSKPIKFSLLVGDRECHSVEEVKQNFDFNSLWDNLCNGSLGKWLRQIGESSLENRIDAFSSADSLTKKMCIYNLFAPEPLSSDEVNEDNVLKLLGKGCIKFGDFSGTPFANNLEIKKSVIENTDNATINRWCESDLDLLKYVYSKKSYDLLNAQNCRTLINQKIVKNDDLAMEIATRKNLNDILECFGKLTVMIDGVAIEMILVKGYSGGNFYIGKYPVTQKQWRAVMGDNPSYFKGEDNPVEQVSWYDCNLFISKLNRMYGRKFRLPKEKEWEFAARGGNKRSNNTYSGSNNLDEVGWYRSDLGLNKFNPYSSLFIHKTNSGEGTHPVGKKKHNELDIYDMSGNVWEWCDDLYQPSSSNRVFRGGSWTNDKSSCKVDSRSCNTPDHKSHNLGFRLAMDA